jgi:hypothetical protein
MLAALALGAAPERVHAQDADPPARVARLSDAEGAVSLEPAGMQQWTAATLNRPLTAGDRLWSDQSSRAELDIGAAVVRLGSNTGLAFLNLDDHTVQVQLSAGTLIVRVRDMQAGETYEIDTPNVALLLQQPGEYRADVNERGDLTVVKVSQGSALAAGADGQQVAIAAQQQLTASGTDKVAYESADLGAPDDFDNWSAARERQFEDAASDEYVANDVPGTQDLDDNGQWQETPEYGYAWIPTTVAAGWAPYRYGHWVWVAPWGWTWVDDAPWGFAPFHYGRWTQCGGRWCWVPGPRQARPVYAPALVAWVGGASLGTSAYGSNVGWFPLAPHEVYVPAYRVSSNYVRRINTANTSRLNNTYITSVYQNSITPTHYANNRATSVTAVPQSIFTSGQATDVHVAALSTALLAEAAVTATAPAIAPIRQSVLGAAEGHGVVKPVASRVNRAVVARTAPPSAPASFDSQLAAIEANNGRPSGGIEGAQLPPGAAVARVRMITARGPVVAASTLPHRPSAAVATAAAQPTLGEREHALQVSRLPPAPHPSTGGTAARTAANLSQRAGDGQTGRAQWTQQHPTPQRGQSASIPVYHPPPPAPDAYAAAAATAGTEETHRPPPRPAPQSSPPRPPPPPHAQPSKTHDSPSRAQQEPVERVTR